MTDRVLSLTPGKGLRTCRDCGFRTLTAALADEHARDTLHAMDVPLPPEVLEGFERLRARVDAEATPADAAAPAPPRRVDGADVWAQLGCAARDAERLERSVAVLRWRLEGVDVSGVGIDPGQLERGAERLREAVEALARARAGEPPEAPTRGVARSSDEFRALAARLKPLGWLLDGWSEHHQAWEASRLMGLTRPFLRAPTAGELLLVCSTFNTAIEEAGHD